MACQLAGREHGLDEDYKLTLSAASRQSWLKPSLALSNTAALPSPVKQPIAAQETRPAAAAIVLRNCKDRHLKSWRRFVAVSLCTLPTATMIMEMSCTVTALVSISRLHHVSTFGTTRLCSATLRGLDCSTSRLPTVRHRRLSSPEQPMQWPTKCHTGTSLSRRTGPMACHGSLTLPLPVSGCSRKPLTSAWHETALNLHTRMQTAKS